MIDDGEDGVGCGSGGEARLGLVGLLFDDLGGGLVDFLLKFLYGGETSYRITTLPLC